MNQELETIQDEKVKLYVSRRELLILNRALSLLHDQPVDFRLYTIESLEDLQDYVQDEALAQGA